MTSASASVSSRLSSTKARISFSSSTLSMSTFTFNTSSENVPVMMRHATMTLTAAKLMKPCTKMPLMPSLIK